MIKVKTIWDSVLYKIQHEANGDLDAAGFNLLSTEAELRILDWLTGDTEGVKPPEPYRVQKNKDLLRPVLAVHEGQVEQGYFDYPEDYYAYDSLYALGVAQRAADCESEEVVTDDNCNTPIDILKGPAFDLRCRTKITGLRPSAQKPIAKQVGRTVKEGQRPLGAFKLAPKDLGSVGLEYVRYPKYGELKTKIDPEYNDRVVDETSSVDYEWDEALRPMLIWLIVDGYSIHNREKALKETNMQTGKTIRG